MDSGKISSAPFFNAIKENLDNDKLSDKNFREFIRNVLPLLEVKLQVDAEFDRLQKEINKKEIIIPNGAQGRLNAPAHFGNGEYFPAGTEVIMYNNIQDEYKNICIEIPESTKKEKTFIVRFDKIDWI